MVWLVVVQIVVCMRMSRSLRAVNVNWNGDGWNVNAISVENPNDWNAGNRVFSETLIFPR